MCTASAAAGGPLFFCLALQGDSVLVLCFFRVSCMLWNAPADASNLHMRTVQAYSQSRAAEAAEQHMARPCHCT